MRSVRSRLLVALLAAVAAVALAAAFGVYRLARQEIDSIFDYHLRQIALSFREMPGGGAEIGAPDAGSEFVIQIWGRDGDRLYLSRSDSGLPETAQLGLATVQVPTGEWRVYSADLDGLVVQVAQPMRVRQELAFTASLRTLAPVLLMIPLLALVMWRIVGHALSPLERLARAVGARSPSTLDGIPEEGAPEEALPLVRSLNDLLGRLDAALRSQRAFVADAAHELRTPLAALSLQLQLVERSRDERERAAALGSLRSGLERTTRVVQQLLTLARAEPDAATGLVRQPVRLDALVQQTVADHAVLAEARRIDLGVTEATDSIVPGDANALQTLLSNLVENAIRYIPERGRVDVSAGMEGSSAFLQVADDGPGIPASDRGRAFDRFFRRAPSRESGSGLGLAIVKAIADRHGASVTLTDSPGGGLTVRVSFPEGVTANSRSAHEAGDAGEPQRGRGPISLP